MTTTATRLVSFLGTSSYREAVYHGMLDGVAFEHRSHYVACALAKAVSANEIVLLETTRARETHGTKLREALLAGGLPTPLDWGDPLPDGGLPGDLWTQFEAMKRALRAPPGWRVVLDITHGYRAMPFFMGAVVPFLRAVDRELPEIRVVYGAFEAGQSGANSDEPVRAPVWDVTSFVEVVDWALALQLFLRTGRAADVAEPTRRLGIALRKEWATSGKAGPQPKLEELGRALAAFGDDLVTLRTGALLLDTPGGRGSARGVVMEIERARSAVEKHLPPLADVLDRVRDTVDPLALSGAGGGSLNTENGKGALVALADLYREMGRVAEAVATVREAFATLHAWNGAAAPGQLRCRLEGRSRADDRFFRNDRERHGKLTAIRNDVMHAGYRSDPRPPKTVFAELDEHLGALRAAVPNPDHTLFANISNHSLAEWKPAQKETALRYADEIVDVPFPAVSPTHKLDDVRVLAKECVSALPGHVTHAMVQGEFTLAVELVRQLQGRGIVCLAATTDRRGDDHQDGSRTTRFEFVAFREYPAIGQTG